MLIISLTLLLSQSLPLSLLVTQFSLIDVSYLGLARPAAAVSALLRRGTRTALFNALKISITLNLEAECERTALAYVRQCRADGDLGAAAEGLGLRTGWTPAVYALRCEHAVLAFLGTAALSSSSFKEATDAIPCWSRTHPTLAALLLPAWDAAGLPVEPASLAIVAQSIALDVGIVVGDEAGRLWREVTRLVCMQVNEDPSCPAQIAAVLRLTLTLSRWDLLVELTRMIASLPDLCAAATDHTSLQSPLALARLYDIAWTAGGSGLCLWQLLCVHLNMLF
eukprot:m.92490 g.92490  ORF g.92490 m.92490 type:complete len:281 (-) comp13773_c0_seq6:1388-2230(-)